MQALYDFFNLFLGKKQLQATLINKLFYIIMSQLATTASSSYFSADKDNLMDKVFCNCTVWISNATGNKKR